MSTGTVRRVLLVSMPFGVLDRPALGLSLLAPAVRRAGFDTSTTYFGFQLAERIGTGTYQWLSYDVPYESFAAESLFAEALYGPDRARDRAFVDEILRDRWHLDEASIRTIDGCRATCTRFIDDVAATQRWSDFDVVGFTSTFQQNLASLALAKRVKELAPDTTVVFGGANWEGEMGEALHRTFPFVDIVCSGEADLTFPNLLGALRDGAPLSGIDGIVYRNDEMTIALAARSAGRTTRRPTRRRLRSLLP